MKLELSSEGRYALRVLVYAARRRGGLGGPVRDHPLHHAAAALRQRPRLRPARCVGRGPERHPRTPRFKEPRRLLLPDPTLLSLAGTSLYLLTIRSSPSILLLK